jgi:hypothetical protein
MKHRLNTDKKASADFADGRRPILLKSNLRKSAQSADKESVFHLCASVAGKK